MTPRESSAGERELQRRRVAVRRGALRSSRQTPAARDYLQQSFSTTFGGPVKIPHLYNGTNRTTFNFSYTGGRNNDLFDQYATVPSAAFRAGDFSASSVPMIDPATGLPFQNNRIPQDRISPASLALMQFIPLANLDGDTRNFHLTDTTRSRNDSFSLRITHSITAPQTGRGGRGGPGGAGGRGGAAGGQAGAARGAGGRAGAGQTDKPGCWRREHHAAAGPGQAQPGQQGQQVVTAQVSRGAGSAAAARRPIQQQAAGRGGAEAGRGQAGGAAGAVTAAAAGHAERDDQLPAQQRQPSERVSRVGGTTNGDTISVPVTGTCAGRSMHAFSFNFTARTSQTGQLCLQR